MQVQIVIGVCMASQIYFAIFLLFYQDFSSKTPAQPRVTSDNLTTNSKI